MKSKRSFFMILLFVIMLIAVVVCVSVTIGAVDISPSDVAKIIVNKTAKKNIFVPGWEDKTENIIWNIRFPRVIMAFIVGAGLALCGVLMQALTKNSLADPYVLGISSGASAGAVCVIVLGWFSFMGGYSVIFGATLGAALSITLSMKIASIRGRITSTQLVLAGIATSALFSATTNLIIYGCHTGSDKTKTALFWMVGSLSGATWGKVKYVAIVFAITVVIVFIFSKPLDVLLLGDDVAETLGVDSKKIKLVIIAASTVLTGVVVSVSGVIGFVGLVVPHIVRNVTGSKHKRLTPMAILVGGLFTVITDLISRVIIAPAELPIGVISAFFGAPFFLYLIRRNSVSRK
ncbi:FecCD family ABC transporter permease [Ruminococcus sp. 5_1_39BFAA]|uniref:FecCD family ABC transporter permease n=1 Tax=Ruminococcus sp. 5_1_39BFAA TaxID=457412 RepID=UPI00356AEFA8